MPEERPRLVESSFNTNPHERFQMGAMLDPKVANLGKGVGKPRCISSNKPQQPSDHGSRRNGSYPSSLSHPVGRRAVRR